ncbi:hypothetical protein NKG60_17610 [Mesorhizobium sp. M1428]|uniref:hypothetical protein n=1 Tax=unclassified Mesorhizobium TaxID=325217 RepID=UPI00333B1796
MIVLPSAVPWIFTGLREGLANGWQTLVAVELIASFEGLQLPDGLWSSALSI